MTKEYKIKIYSKNHEEILSISADAESSVVNAQEILSDFFKNASNRLINYPGSTQWAFYDRFFHEVAIPYSKYKDHLERCLNAEKIESEELPEDLRKLITHFCDFHSIKLTVNKRSPLFNFGPKQLVEIILKAFLCVHSLLIIAFLGLTRTKDLVAIWTGDYLTEKRSLDPRLGNLEEKLNQKKIAFIPFVRTVGVSPKQVFKNFLQRKGFAIYYHELNSIFLLFYSFESKQNKHDNFFESIFYSLYIVESKALKIQITFWNKIFKAIKVRSLIAWFLSSRTAALIWAAKKSDIRSIGFMHGMSVLSFMGHEFMPEYKGEPIGPDYFGTWSNWWNEYFKKYSNIYIKDNIEVCGPLKKSRLELNIKSRSKKNNSTNLKVYIISEKHLPVDQIFPYLSELKKTELYEMTLKIRPFGEDHFFKKLQLHPFYKDLNLKISNKQTPECFEEADVIIGTHSTAVLEGLILNRPILFLNTKKWGDYFNFQSTYQGECPFWVASPSDLQKKIQMVINSDIDWKSLYSKFFGNSNGAEWIINKIKDKTT
jgi:hypothetical protein